ncbi:type II secretion system F family protein [Actinopolyspora mortivallis]|uniref:type II secretion system F family protein n=1 Tax=Actinopolyspora mortivallis TaxID=33906 RepID=UPI0003A59CCF|nr:type II secretion system F family protein [Actinopolyspora mortivallis]
MNPHVGSTLPFALLALGTAVVLLGGGTASRSRLRVRAEPRIPSRFGGARQLRARAATFVRRRGGAASLAAGAGLLAGLAAAVLFGPVAAGLSGAGTAWGLHAWLTRNPRKKFSPLRSAAGWNLFAAGVRAGLSTPVLLREVAEEFEGRAAEVLNEVARALELGSDPVAAWEPASRVPETAELAGAARRSARSGSGLTPAAEELSARAWEEVREEAEARVRRTEVWVTAPLGLCFLPAFFCLGVLPVVLGMVHGLELTR